MTEKTQDVKEDAAGLPQVESSSSNADSDDGQQNVSPYIVLLALLVLLVGSYFLCMKLAQMSRTEDCLMAGRHNCASIADTP